MNTIYIIRETSLIENNWVALDISYWKHKEAAIKAAKLLQDVTPGCFYDVRAVYLVDA